MKKFCEECKSQIDDNFDFCPFCGKAISLKAQKLENQKMINANLVLIAKLIDETNDIKTLEILNKLAKKLSNND